MSREPTIDPALGRTHPTDPELRRQMARAQAEATSARFWLSFVRTVLGGLVAVLSGALAGATLWFLLGAETNLLDFGPTLLTAAGGEEEQAASLEPGSEAEPDSVMPNLATPDVATPDLSMPDLAETDTPTPDLAVPDPFEQDLAEAGDPPGDPQLDSGAAPILVPEETLNLSWMEEPPIEEGDQIAGLIEQQSAGSAEGGQGSDQSTADLTAVERTATGNIYRRPTPGEIDAALATLDLEELAPKDVVSTHPPAWRRNAVPVAKPFEGPVIALVIDDLGLNRPNTRRTIELPGPLTLALMTYAETLQEFADSARANGHELLVHFPMAPRDPRYDPGPNALHGDLGSEELARRLSWGLSRFEGFVGINNHMGSGFTTLVPGMAQVMMELKARGLLYLDSLTVPGAVGVPLADRLGVPFAKRDVFIDNDYQDREAIRRQLQQLERVAIRRGRAIGIAHPHDETLEELAVWLPEVQRRGFTLVPLSALVFTPRGLAVTPKTSNTPG